MPNECANERNLITGQKHLLPLTLYHSTALNSNLLLLSFGCPTLHSTLAYSCFLSHSTLLYSNLLRFSPALSHSTLLHLALAQFRSRCLSKFPTPPSTNNVPLSLPLALIFAFQLLSFLLACALHLSPALAHNNKLGWPWHGLRIVAIVIVVVVTFQLFRFYLLIYDLVKADAAFCYCCCSWCCCCCCFFDVYARQQQQMATGFHWNATTTTTATTTMTTTQQVVSPLLSLPLPPSLAQSFNQC